MKIEWITLAACLGLVACNDGVPTVWHGYVEAEPVRLAVPLAGRLTQLNVNRGDVVKAGQPLFALEQGNELATRNEAAARLQQSRAQAADLDSGKRPDELAVIHAGLQAARATLKQAEQDLRRQTELAQSGFSSAASLDTARTRRDAEAAQVKEWEAQLKSAQLAGRKATQQAAHAASDAAAAQLAQKEWSLAQKTVTAPLAATVEERYYRLGEWVPAGSPVLSLLAPHAIKARFWLPEDQLSRTKPGSKVWLRCDGCQRNIAATIRYVAAEAEFTPPVIYSKESRGKLVFLAEATPDQATDLALLHPGLPLDVLPVQP